MTDTKTIARVLIGMQYLPNSPMNGGNIDSVIEAYEKDLSDLPPDLLEAAAKQYRQTGVFFPPPGALRTKALELMTDAARIPTATEAWSYVVTAIEHKPAIDCEQGHALRQAIDGKIGGAYLSAVMVHGKHIDECKICSRGGYTENFRHPAVAEAVRLLGGRDRILTDDPVSDRARFIPAYNEIVGREKTRAFMHPEVKEFVEETRARLEDSQSAFETGERKEFAIQELKQLTEGMERK